MVDPPPAAIEPQWHTAMAHKKKKEEEEALAAQRKAKEDAAAAQKKADRELWQKYAAVKNYSVEDSSWSSYTPERRAVMYDKEGIRPAHHAWKEVYPDEANLRRQFIEEGKVGYTNYSGSEKPRSKMTEAELRDEFSAETAKTRMVAPPAHERTDLPFPEKMAAIKKQIIANKQQIEEERSPLVKMGVGLANVAEYAPFIGGGKEIGELIGMGPSLSRFAEGKETPEDYLRLAQYELHEAEAADTTIPEDIVEGVAIMPGFMVEIGMTAGIWTGIKAGARKVLVKSMKELGKEKTKKIALKMGLKTGAGQFLRKSAEVLAPGAIFSGVVGSSRTLADAWPTHTVYADPGSKTGFAVTEKDSWMLSLPRSFLNNWIEYTAEVYTGKGLQKLGKHFKPGVKGVKDSISSDAIPDSHKAWLKNKLISAWKIQNPGKTTLSGKVAYNGLMAEGLEERVTEILQGANEALFSTLPGADEERHVGERFGITGHLVKEAGYQVGLKDETPEEASRRRSQFGRAATVEAAVLATVSGAMKGLNRVKYGPDPGPQPVDPNKDPVLALLPNPLYREKITGLVRDNKTSRTDFKTVQLPDNTTLLSHFPRADQRKRFILDLREHAEEVNLGNIDRLAELWPSRQAAPDPTGKGPDVAARPSEYGQEVDPKKGDPVPKHVISGNSLARRVGNQEESHILELIKGEDYTEEVVDLHKIAERDNNLRRYLVDSKGSPKTELPEGTKPFDTPPIINSRGQVIDGYKRISEMLEAGAKEVVVYKGRERSVSRRTGDWSPGQKVMTAEEAGSAMSIPGWSSRFTGQIDPSPDAVDVGNVDPKVISAIKRIENGDDTQKDHDYIGTRLALLEAVPREMKTDQEWEDALVDARRNELMLGEDSPVTFPDEGTRENWEQYEPHVRSLYTGAIQLDKKLREDRGEGAESLTDYISPKQADAILGAVVRKPGVLDDAHVALERISDNKFTPEDQDFLRNLLENHEWSNATEGLLRKQMEPGSNKLREQLAQEGYPEQALEYEVNRQEEKILENFRQFQEVRGIVDLMGIRQEQVDELGREPLLSEEALRQANRGEMGPSDISFTPKPLMRDESFAEAINNLATGEWSESDIAQIIPHLEYEQVEEGFDLIESREEVALSRELQDIVGPDNVDRITDAALKQSEKAPLPYKLAKGALSDFELLSRSGEQLEGISTALKNLGTGVYEEADLIAFGEALKDRELRRVLLNRFSEKNLYDLTIKGDKLRPKPRKEVHKFLTDVINDVIEDRKQEALGRLEDDYTSEKEDEVRRLADMMDEESPIDFFEERDLNQAWSFVYDALSNNNRFFPNSDAKRNLEQLQKVLEEWKDIVFPSDTTLEDSDVSKAIELDPLVAFMEDFFYLVTGDEDGTDRTHRYNKAIERIKEALNKKGQVDKWETAGVPPGTTPDELLDATFDKVFDTSQSPGQGEGLEGPDPGEELNIDSAEIGRNLWSEREINDALEVAEDFINRAFPREVISQAEVEYQGGITEQEVDIAEEMRDALSSWSDVGDNINQIMALRNFFEHGTTSYSIDEEGEASEKFVFFHDKLLNALDKRGVITEFLAVKGTKPPSTLGSIGSIGRRPERIAPPPVSRDAPEPPKSRHEAFNEDFSVPITDAESLIHDLRGNPDKGLGLILKRLSQDTNKRTRNILSNRIIEYIADFRNSVADMAVKTGQSNADWSNFDDEAVDEIAEIFHDYFYDISGADPDMGTHDRLQYAGDQKTDGFLKAKDIQAVLDKLDIPGDIETSPSQEARDFLTKEQGEYIIRRIAKTGNIRPDDTFAQVALSYGKGEVRESNFREIKQLIEDGNRTWRDVTNADEYSEWAKEVFDRRVKDHLQRGGTRAIAEDSARAFAEKDAKRFGEWFTATRYLAEARSRVPSQEFTEADRTWADERREQWVEYKAKEKRRKERERSTITKEKVEKSFPGAEVNSYDWGYIVELKGGVLPIAFIYDWPNHTLGEAIRTWDQYKNQKGWEWIQSEDGRNSFIAQLMIRGGRMIGGQFSTEYPVTDKVPSSTWRPSMNPKFDFGNLEELLGDDFAWGAIKINMTFDRSDSSDRWETLLHEIRHFAIDSGYFTGSELAAIRKKYDLENLPKDQEGAEEQSETFAQGAETYKEIELKQKVLDGFNRFMSKLGLQELDADAVERLLFTKGFWKRRADIERYREDFGGFAFGQFPDNVWPSQEEGRVSGEDVPPIERSSIALKALFSEVNDGNQISLGDLIGMKDSKALPDSFNLMEVVKLGNDMGVDARTGDWRPVVDSFLKDNQGDPSSLNTPPNHQINMSSLTGDGAEPPPNGYRMNHSFIGGENLPEDAQRVDLALPGETIPFRTAQRKVDEERAGYNLPVAEIIEKVNERRSPERDQQLVQDMRDPDKAFNVFDHQHVLQMTRELVLTGDLADKLLADELMLLRREKVGEAARVLGHGRDPLMTPDQRAESALLEAVYGLDPELALRLRDLESSDPALRRAATAALAREKRRLEKAKEFFNKLGYEFNERGFKKLLENISADKERLNDLQKLLGFLANSRKSKSNRYADMFTEIRYGFMLSGHTTQLVNASSNALWGAYRELESIGGALASSMTGAYDNIQIKDYRHYLKGDIVKGIGLAFKHAWHALVFERQMIEEEVLGRFSQDNLASNITKNKFEVRTGAIPGRAGMAFRAVFGFGPMRMVDQFFKTLFTHMNVGVQASAIARQEAKEVTDEGGSVSESEMLERINQLIANRESSAWVLALKEAEGRLFQDEGGPTSKAVINWVGKGRDTPVLGFLFRHLFAPFVRTPARLAGNAFVRIPGLSLPVLLPKIMKNHNEGKPLLSGVSNEVVGNIAVMIATAMLWGLVDEDEEETQVTGAAGSLGEKSRSWRYQEGVPGAQSVKLGGRWYRYDRADPFAFAFATIVDQIHEFKTGEKGLVGTVKGQSVALARSVGGQVQEKTFFRGIGDIMKAVDTEEGGRRWIASQLTSFIPNIWQQAVREGRVTIGDKRSDTMIGEVLKRSEVTFSYDLHDVWGNKAKTSDEWYLPRNKSGKLFVGDRAYMNWNRLNPDARYPKYPVRPSRIYRDNKVERRMDDKMYSEFSQIAGKLAANTIEKTVSPELARGGSDLAVSICDSAISRARQVVLDQLESTGNLDIDMDFQTKLLQSKLLAKGIGLLKLDPPVKLTGKSDKTFNAEKEQWERDREAAMEFLKTYSTLNKKEQIRK